MLTQSSQNRYVALQLTFRNADTHKKLVLIFLHLGGGGGGGGGGLPIFHMVRRVVLLLLLLDDDGPSMRSPYIDEGRWRHDRWVPRPSLRHPRLSPWSQLLHSANDQAFITCCGIDFDSFLTLLT